MAKNHVHEITGVLMKYHITPRQQAMIVSLLFSAVRGERSVFISPRSEGKHTVYKAAVEIAEILDLKNFEKHCVNKHT